LKNFTLEEWIDWQCKLHPTNMDFNLSRVIEVAKKLKIDQPIPKVITVAGTNGKGSTVSILESILYESDYKVGSYTSPHLLNFNERIKIDKVPVKTNSICDAFESIEETRGNITLTYFEFSTLAALIIFSKSNLDVIILEVGLGGRLDAVNIINPDISIITNIGLDHTDILGDDIEQIAYEKAGVMRKNKSTVIGYKNVHNSILAEGENINSKISKIDEHYHAEVRDDDSWVFKNSDGIKINCEHPGIKGDIQIKNAAAAIQAIHLCDGLELNEKKVLIGLKNAKIIGRFQIFETKPTVILDVAHNPQSIDILKDNLKKYFPNKKFHAVFGVLKDKDVDEILIKLKGVFDSWHISESTNERALRITELKDKKFFTLEKPSIYGNINKAFDGAIENIKKEDEIIVVFGSSYTVAPILSKLINE
tara:strand:- start:227 stop:1492 length:1266 start_codon:yes stop_codon:yes gene_type:complete